MNNNSLFLRSFALIAISTVSCLLSTAFAQDYMYIYQGGVVKNTYTLQEIDSIKVTMIRTEHSGCGAYIAAYEWKEFMCHNLGANTSLNAMKYSDQIQGNYYQWGRPADAWIINYPANGLSVRCIAE